MVEKTEEDTIHNKYVQSSPFDKWGIKEGIIMMTLFVFGVFSRFWVIQHIRSPMFRETEELIEINNLILNSEYFIPEEPPFASMVLAYLSKSMLYKGEFYKMSRERNYTYETMHYVSIRSIPAFFSSLNIPIAYALAKVLDCSDYTSFLASIFIMTQNILVSSERCIGIEGIYHLLFIMTLMCTAVLYKMNERSIYKWIFIILQSLFLGLSASSHISSFSLVIIVFAFNIVRNDIKALITNIVFVFVSIMTTFVIYKLSFDMNRRTNRSFIDLTAFFSLIYDSINYWINRPYSHEKFIFEYEHDLGSLGSRQAFALFNIPAIISIFVSIILSLYVIIKEKSFMTYLLIGFMISLAQSFYLVENSIMSFDIPYLFSFLFTPLVIERILSQELQGFAVTIILGFVIFYFILKAPLTYAYHNYATE